MVKSFLTLVVVMFAGTALLAQSGASSTSTTTKKPLAGRTAPHAAVGPTKVTGEGTKTASGLQYWDIRVGTGKEAKEGDTVMVHYTGWFTNGKKFDSSIGRGPFEVGPLGNAPVIKGWNEGIVGMKVGGKRQLRIPPDLAYGAKGYPGAIPPNSTLIFDVRLLSIK